MYPVLLNLRRKRLIINDYLITQAAPLVQIFFPGLAEVGRQVFQMGWEGEVDFCHRHLFNKSCHIQAWE